MDAEPSITDRTRSLPASRDCSAEVSEEPPGSPGPDYANIAKAALVSGGGFATGITGILGAAGMWGLAGQTVLHALVALCFVAALTMLTTANVVRSLHG